MAVLDSILVKDLIDAPVTVNLDYATEGIRIDNRQDEFSIQMDYNGGNGAVDMDFHLEVSNDGITYVSVGLQNVTDDTGTHIFDLDGSGTRYLRVAIVVNTGSIILNKVFYNGKRLH